MKNLLILVIFLFISNVALAQKTSVSDTTQKKNQKSNINQSGSDKKDPQKVHITPEASGVKRSIGYKFSTLPEIGDPGNGVFRYDKRNVVDVRYIIVDDTDISGEDQTKWYSTWDKTTGATGRGSITIADKGGSVICVFDFTGVFIDGNGFWKLPVKYISGSLPADGSVCYYIFERIAHSGASDTGNQGPQVKPAPEIVNKETIAAAQTNNQTQVTQLNQGNEVTHPVQVIQVKDTIQPARITQTNQGNQGNKESKIVAGTEVILASQVHKPTQSVPETKVNKSTRITETTQTTQQNQENRRATTTQTTQTKPVTKPAQTTQTAQATQTKPITQTTQATQTKPVTQTTQATQTKTVTQTEQTTTTKPVTQTSQTTQPSQTTQEKQGVQSTQTRPSTQTNQPARYGQASTYQSTTGNQSGSRRKWYRGIIEVGYGPGIGDYGINNFRFNFINAIRIGKYSSIGLGVGYRYLYADNSTDPYLVSSRKQIPVFIDLRTTFSSKKLTPYLAMGIGSSTGYGSSETEKGGTLFTASGGIWYNISDRFAVFAGIAYELQKLEYSDTDPFTNNYKKNANSLSFNIGISF